MHARSFASDDQRFPRLSAFSVLDGLEKAFQHRLFGVVITEDVISDQPAEVTYKLVAGQIEVIGAKMLRQSGDSFFQPESAVITVAVNGTRLEVYRNGRWKVPEQPDLAQHIYEFVTNFRRGAYEPIQRQIDLEKPMLARARQEQARLGEQAAGVVARFNHAAWFGEHDLSGSVGDPPMTFAAKTPPGGPCSKTCPSSETNWEAGVIYVASTGHRLLARPFQHLGTPGVEVASDIVAGDGATKIALTAKEMDALCRWWTERQPH